MNDNQNTPNTPSKLKTEPKQTHFIFSRTHFFSEVKKRYGKYLFELISIGIAYAFSESIPITLITLLASVLLHLSYLWLKQQNSSKFKVYSGLIGFSGAAFVTVALLYFTTDVFKSDNPKTEPTLTTNNESPKTTDTFKSPTTDIPKTQKPCKPEQTVKFYYGKPNRTILIFDSTDCTGNVIYSSVTDSNGYCLITFINDCHLPHFVRVSCEATPEYLKSICSYIIPDKWPKKEKYVVTECLP